MPTQFRLPPFKRTVLPGGLTIVHQKNPISRAFCVGVWTRTGSRDERKGEEGLCHFLEHMLFKGTRKRTAFEMSQQIEQIGGSLDAFTTKETLCVYAHVLQDHKSLALDILGDMLSDSTFSAELVPLERQVVLQEINDVLDAPDDLIHDLFASAVFPDHPLGKPTLGTAESVSTFSRRDLLRFWRGKFRASNIVVAVYGNISHSELCRACARLFDFPGGSVHRNSSRPRHAAVKQTTVRRKLRQLHVCMGNRTFSYLEDRKYSLMVLTTLLGGGMSSRLFQRIREEMGLSYSVFTYSDHTRDAGLMATYMAVRPKKAREAIGAVIDEFEKIRTGNLKGIDLEATKQQLKGRILLGLETSTARMMRIARNELNYGRQIGETELIHRLDAVTLDDVLEVASDALDPDRLSIVSLGPVAARSLGT